MLIIAGIIVAIVIMAKISGIRDYMPDNDSPDYDLEESDAYWEGYRNGCDDGYNDGYHDGYCIGDDDYWWK